jgi:hypothetical protein
MKVQRIARPFAAGIIASVMISGVGAAAATARAHPEPIVPATVVRGLTGGELIGAGFKASYSSATEISCLRLGRHDDILVMGFNGQTTTCTVKPGTPVLVVTGGACSDVEQAPFYGKDAAAQLACIRDFNNFFLLSIDVSVDGGPSVDLLDERYEFASPQQTFLEPEGNVDGLPAGTPGTLVAAGYVGVIRGLTPGRHRIVSVVHNVFGETIISTMIVNVVPGH